MKPILYHTDGSTCSQKVRVALNEKGVEWESREIDLIAGEQKSKAFLDINPKGAVPAMVHQDVTITESTLINEYVDDAFDGPALLPQTAAGRVACREWPKYIDEDIFPFVSYLMYATVLRFAQKDLPKEQVMGIIDALTDPTERAHRHEIYQKGLDAPICHEVAVRLLSLLDKMQAQLSQSEWLCGDAFSLADCAALPFVLRLDDMGLNVFWDDGKLPHVARWLAAIKARPSYQAGVKDWLAPHVNDLFGIVSDESIAHFKQVDAERRQVS